MGSVEYSNIKCTIAYSGSRYFGWQKTREGPSIESALQESLERLLQHPVLLQAASRTDRGVHAEAQVVNFFSPTKDLSTLERALRATLPSDISLIRLEKAKVDFHPTLDCLSKEYHYQICNHFVQLPFYRAISWRFHYPLRLDLMQLAANDFIGFHNFTSLSNERVSEEKAFRRIFRISVCPLMDNRLKIEIEGESFLYKMVRNLVGTLVYVGCGKISLREASQILSSRDRRLAGVTAPSHGLCLKKVSY